MAIIAYVYDRNNGLLGQIFGIVDFQCTIKLNDISTADLGISNESLHDALLLIKENNRIKVVLGDEYWVEKTLIHGIIRGAEASLATTTIKIEDMISIFDDKIIYNQINFTGTIAQLLQNILDWINLREDAGISLSCNVTETVTKEYPRGESFGNILKDLTQNTYEYCIANNILIFQTSIWVDRTGVWSDYREFIWDINSPFDRTIRDAKLVMDLKQMCNSWLGKDDTVLVTAEDWVSIAEFGRIERSISNNGNIQEAVNNYVQERKDSIKEFDVSPNISDFFFCDIGDLVRVYINSGNDMMFFDGALKVVEKSYTVWELPKLTLKLAKSKIKTITLNEKIKELNRRMQSLELKQ